MLHLADVSALEILERVDEYSLYCFYLDFEPVIGAKYRSRIRTGDDRASFGMYVRKHGGDKPHEYMWKDQALPVPNYGDIFDLVQRLHPELENRLQAMIKVAQDFGLLEGTTAVTKQLIVTPCTKEPSHIRIRSRPFSSTDLSYWKQFNVTPEILSKYLVKAVEFYYLFDSDVYPRSPYGLMYAYQIFDKFQLYQPVPKQFYMDWTELCIPGFQQLSGQRELLVVTKSVKDIMCLRSLGIEAIAPRAENMIPSPDLIQWLKQFKKVYILMDNDSKSSPHLYPFESVQIPIESGEKDVTDYLKRYGVSQTLELLKTLLHL